MTREALYGREVNFINKSPRLLKAGVGGWFPRWLSRWLQTYHAALIASATIIPLLLILPSCTKRDNAPSSDSLLAHPLVHADSARAIVDSGSGLVIDPSRTRSPEHEKLLERFEATDVAKIYHDYRPLRFPGMPESKIQEFLKSHKLTQDELLAILDEGDRLGWSKAK